MKKINILDSKLLEICNLYERGESQFSLAKKFGYSRSVISSRVQLYFGNKYKKIAKKHMIKQAGLSRTKRME